jgi:outer membrane protein assembly factor BamE (lipoprotein component of BamABCDE complex)
MIILGYKIFYSRRVAMRRRNFVIPALIFFFCLSACSAQHHRDAVRDDTGDRISVGTVQREIRVGMSGADVVTALGSPNMVTTDGQRRETWVYDKIATERVYSTSSAGGGAGAGAAGGSGSMGGVLGLVFGGSSRAGASSASQRTLTIIIKFDEQNLVRDFSYRQSSF